MRASVPETVRRSLLAVAAVLGAFVSLSGPRAVAGPEPAYAPPPLSTAQIDELVAPVALYPDVVLDSLLPATTDPVDVAAAAAFVASQGGNARGAPEGTAWDPSVVALLQFPDVLRWMGDNPSWVEQTGFAVATQETDVLEAIQRYRATARAAGVLTSSAYATVTAGPASRIYIQPVESNVVYVPVYDPWLLRGPYVYSPTVPFFSAWLSFSFGSVGFWSRNRIFWGTGIYAYGDPWWWGTWRNSAADWGTGRPTRWTATYRDDQPWTRAGWSASGSRTRPGAHRTSTSRDVYVAPPRTRTYTRTLPGSTATDPIAPGWTQPVAPAAPITRWGRSGTPTRTPRTVAPRPAPRPAAPIPTPRLVTPPSVVPGRGTVGGWTRRGTGSLDGRARPAPRATPVVPQPRAVPVPRAAPAPRAVPSPRAAPAPRGTPPQIRSFPPERPKAPAADGSRVRAEGRRGRRSLGS